MSTDENRKPPGGLLYPRDQLAVAGLVVAALLGILLWWTSSGGWSGRLVDIDRAAPRGVRFQVDVNTASWPELVQIPGIGRVLAERIVKWREEHGPFRTTEQLLQVQGIGPRTLERIRPYLLPLPDDPPDGAAENGPATPPAR